jgi:endonuclease/exonuclease/phosphatase family metal-dependent hydrolase
MPEAAGAQGVPSGWVARDIGSVGASGSASGSNGSFTLRGAGADIWGSTDGFQFAYRSLTGDGEIITRVTGVDYLHAWSKAGVMMRESLSSGARHAFMFASAGKGLAFQRRLWSDGASSHTGAAGGPGDFVRITRSGNTFDAYHSTDGSSWNWVGSEWIDMPATIYAGVAVTSHYFGAVTTATFTNTSVNEWGSGAAAGGSLPSGWSHGDIGAVATAGWSDTDGTEFRLGGSGADIWGGSDEFHFTYRLLSGDGSIVARVASLDYLDAWTKSGVMMRESLSASSAHAFMLVSAGNGNAFQRRTSNGSSSSHTVGSSGSYVKLVRSGNTFSAYSSSDGSNWSRVGSESISMGATIYVGLAVTSHSDGAVASATFADVEVTEGVAEATLPPPPPVSGSTLRVLHWNTHHLTGTDGVFDPDRTAYWIARSQPDLVSLNEVDDSWFAELIRGALEARTGVRWNYAWSGWGNLILSRLPMTTSDVCSFNPAVGRVAAHISTTFNGRQINLWSAHLATESTDTRAYEVANLHNCASSWDEARILAGDFNMQAGSAEYYAMTAAYADSWAAARDKGATINISSCDGCTRNTRIDYIFTSYNAWFLSVQSAEIIDTRDANGYMASDHRPLVVTYTVQ